MTLSRLFVVTGETSGDLHGSMVIRRLLAQEPSVEVQAVGGPYIEALGVPMLHRQEGMGVIGMSAITAVPRHYKLGMQIIKHLKQFKPNAVLLIDYGAFNLWIAGHIRKLGIPVFYYIPPQVWASRKGRLKRIKKVINHVFCIFPFEKPMYDAQGIPATFVGHPIVEQMQPVPDREQFCQTHGLNPEVPIIGLFPGSRRMEIQTLTDRFVQALPLIQAEAEKRGLGKFQFVLAKSPSISDALLSQMLNPHRESLQQVSFHIVHQANHSVLALSRAILAASGTVTLEAAMYNTPAVIAYRVSKLTYWVFKRLVYVTKFGLPNLLSRDPNGFLPELLNEAVTPQNLAQAILPYLDTASSEAMAAQSHFEQIKHDLGTAPASENVVSTLNQLLSSPT